MGKPFKSELELMGASLRWVLGLEQSRLGRVSVAPREPMVAAGSGGSQSAAVFASMLHRSNGGMAYAVTPLELLGLARTSNLSDVLLLSASGANKDILAAARAAIASEARCVRCLTTTASSPLSEILRLYVYGVATDLDLPSGKDGFLATNSLVATMAALLRQYGQPEGELELLAEKLDRGSWPQESEAFDELLERPEWLVVHSGWGSPAAYDLESKLSEAALRTVQLTDLRNFAHGRHHWLAKRPETSCVLLVADEDHAELAEKTAKQIPAHVPRLILRPTLSAAAGAIELTCGAMKMVERVGRLAGIDPGRPGVPSFGRTIYHLGPGKLGAIPKPSIEVRAAARKEGSAPLKRPEEVTVSAAKAFLGRLTKADFTSVVLDFDGTLVDADERLVGLRESIARRLESMLEAGVGVGIATGRGRSVRAHLRSAVPERYWARVLVGYYNGAEVVPLSSESLPARTPANEGPLAAAASVLSSNPRLNGRVTLELRPHQLTAVPTEANSWPEVRFQIQESLMVQGHGGVKIFESSHSIDVLPMDVSKLAVVKCCEESFGGGSVLCVGDRGAWPGNDCELLSTPYSLSVDSVSSSLDTCWNLLPAGVLGAAGTLYYLDGAILGRSAFRLKGLK